VLLNTNKGEPMNATKTMYLVVDFFEGRGERGINRDLSDHAPEDAELLTPDEARALVDRLRAAGRGGYAITEGRFFGDEADPSDFDF
jgi:hypothetical protein